MATSPRSWWRNCALEADAEMVALDRLEDQISPLEPNIARVRTLIASFELCHHKADRWVHHIIAAIGAGDTDKGLGSRPTHSTHPAEATWQAACDALSAWCAGHPSAILEGMVGDRPVASLLGRLGEPTPLKIWQVERVIEKISSLIGWPHPQTEYNWLLLRVSEYSASYHDECPEAHREHEELWLQTARTIIQDSLDGKRAELSLALAIDMLWPCHWRFLDNLEIVLAAIGGALVSEQPFSACGRNIAIFPAQRSADMARVVHSLQVFRGAPTVDRNPDPEILALLGEATLEKRWLAASLDKTIRLQLDPPLSVRNVSAMTGPDWLKHRRHAG